MSALLCFAAVLLAAQDQVTVTEKAEPVAVAPSQIAVPARPVRTCAAIRIAPPVEEQAVPRVTDSQPRMPAYRGLPPCEKPKPKEIKL